MVYLALTVLDFMSCNLSRIFYRMCATPFKAFQPLLRKIKGEKSM